MGLSVVGALLAIALAFIAQTPRLISRLGLTAARLDLRARAFTGYGMAFLLLALGFFLAGVPLGESTTSAEAPSPQPTAASGEEVAIAGTVSPMEAETAPETITNSSQPQATTPTGSSSSGMVARPRETATAEGVAAEATIGPGTTPEAGASEALPAVEPGDVAEPTAEPTATLSPTATVSPTPEPTPTPTPILGPTARVGDNTSTLPVRKTPNGEPLALVYRGDTVLLLSGHAFHSGGLWSEISTVDGVVGWVPDVFLDYGDGTG
jgi:hypothetical protein